ncbi:MAG: hypothetical protein IPO02_10530 [Bacteroidetes bacterium]|nr:hypothetical protein [Bacteroidota bacterium]
MGADEKPCAGAPTAGTLSATNLGPVCVSLANDTLDLAGYSNASGIYFQYQSSTDGISFVNAGTPTSKTLLLHRCINRYHVVSSSCDMCQFWFVIYFKHHTD